jgi:hypothetical protein
VHWRRHGRRGVVRARLIEADEGAPKAASVLLVSREAVDEQDGQSRVAPSERQSVAQMVGFICREIGVLTLVFEVLHTIWDPESTREVASTWVNALLSVTFIVAGIVIERRRR